MLTCSAPAPRGGYPGAPEGRPQGHQGRQRHHLQRLAVCQVHRLQQLGPGPSIRWVAGLSHGPTIRWVEGLLRASAGWLVGCSALSCALVVSAGGRVGLGQVWGLASRLSAALVADEPLLLVLGVVCCLTGLLLVAGLLCCWLGLVLVAGHLHKAASIAQSCLCSCHGCNSRCKMDRRAMLDVRQKHTVRVRRDWGVTQ
jgi:hypothetical protein